MKIFVLFFQHTGVEVITDQGQVLNKPILKQWLFVEIYRWLYIQYWVFAVKYFESAKNLSESWWTHKRINFLRWSVAIIWTCSVFITYLIQAILEPNYITDGSYTAYDLYKQTTGKHISDYNRWSFIAFELICTMLSFYSIVVIY